ncbi:MAG TPA: hypothetical protein VGF59_03600 [Bryobacteraceae bacterium]
MTTKTAMRFALCGALINLWTVTSAAYAAPDAAGHWEGKIQIPEHELGIAVDLAKDAKGAWIGSMTVVGSSSVDVPLGNLAVDGASVRFTATLPENASFEGNLSADGNTLAGSAANKEDKAPFQLTRSGAANVKVPPPSSMLAKEFAGPWEGAVETNGQVRRIALTLSAAPDGTAVATLISLNRNLQIPVTTVTIHGQELQLESRAISGTYRGTLGASGEIAGEWSERTNRFPLTFKRAAGGDKK